MEKVKLGRILSGNNITNIMFGEKFMFLYSCYKPVVIQPRAFVERIKASLLPNSFESPMSFPKLWCPAVFVLRPDRGETCTRLQLRPENSRS